MKRSIKIWTAVGAASVAVVTPALAAMVQPTLIVQSDGALEHIILASEGGEGGEAAVAADAAQSEADFIAAIGFLDGHLRAAADVYAEGQPDMAYVSASHTRADMDEAFAAAMAKYNGVDFDAELAVLEAAIEGAESVDAVQSAYDAVHAKMLQSIAERGAADQLTAIVKLVRLSASEFNAALDGGAVVDPLEYQHSYGFVQVARDIIAIADPEVRTANAAVFNKIDDQLALLDGTWADLTGASPEPTDPSVIAGIAARIEIAALSLK